MASVVKLYTMQITLIDTAQPYPNKEEAEKDAQEWAQSIADAENCMIAEVKVTEEQPDESIDFD